MQFSLLIISTLCCFYAATALPRLKESHHPKQKHGGGESDGRQQQHQMPRRLPFPTAGQMPEYLQQASEKAYSEYQQIFEDDKGQSSKGELKAKMAKWADTNGMKEEYDMYLDEQEQKKESFQKLMSANLGGDALKVFKKIWEITHNDDMSRNEECQQLQDLLEGLKQRVRNMVPLVPSGISGAPPAPGCFPQAERSDEAADQQH